MDLSAQFREILTKKIGQDGDQSYAVFDYATEFDEFWGEGPIDGSKCPAHKIVLASRQKALLIVWGGGPDDKSSNGKLLAPHLTPLDWTLAFSMRMLALKKAHLLDFSIHIIDLTVKAYEDAFALRMRHTLLAEMPWVRLYSPLVPKDNNGKPVRYRRCYKPITDLINIGDQGPAFSLPTDVTTIADSVKGCEAVVYRAADRNRAIRDRDCMAPGAGC